MTTAHSDDNLLVGTDPEALTQECRILRERERTGVASADEAIDFLDGYNAFINHASRPFTPMLESKMLL